MEEKEIPKLEDGEEIVYLTKAIKIISGYATFINLIIIMLFIGLVMDYSYLQILQILYLLIFLFIIGIGIFIWDALTRENRTLYYITTKKVIKVVGNGLFPHKPKLDEINLDDIAYIEHYDGLWIVQKGINGDRHYTGEEIEKFENLPKDVKKIQFDLEGKEAQKIIKIIIKKFLEILPAFQHPNLEDIYLNRR